jgi:transposase
MQETLTALRQQLEALGQELAKLRHENEVLKQENRSLREALMKAERASKRQAAPFSRGKGKADPKRPGRKSGEGYGCRASRPGPGKVDRVLEVPVTTGLQDAQGQVLCPDCHFPLTDHCIYPQYQTDLPAPPPALVTQFNVEVAHCPRCGTSYQGRHPDQISDALHGANNQLGPRALGLMAQLKYEAGLSFGKVQRLMAEHFGLPVGRATVARAAQRLARQATPSYHQLIFSLRQSRVIWADETGWRIGRQLAWLWVFTSAEVTVYAIDPHRGHEVIESILGPSFPGTLTSDGLPAYDVVVAGARQQCLGHLIKHCRTIEASKTRGAVCFSRQVAAVLRAGVRVHQRREQLTPQGFKQQRGKIEAAMDRLLQKHLTDPDNARLARRLKRHRRQLFTYLHDETGQTDPTNNAAERALRPSVITRKVGACNRSEKGANATAILTSVLRTCQQKATSFVNVMTDLLRQRDPKPHSMTEAIS